MLTANEVATALKNAKSPGQKAAATKLKQKFIDERARSGRNAKWVEAGLKAYMTRTA